MHKKNMYFMKYENGKDKYIAYTYASVHIQKHIKHIIA